MATVCHMNDTTKGHMFAEYSLFYRALLQKEPYDVITQTQKGVPLSVAIFPERDSSALHTFLIHV